MGSHICLAITETAVAAPLNELRSRSRYRWNRKKTLFPLNYRFFPQKWPRKALRAPEAACSRDNFNFQNPLSCIPVNEVGGYSFERRKRHVLTAMGQLVTTGHLRDNFGQEINIRLPAINSFVTAREEHGQPHLPCNHGNGRSGAPE